MTRAADYDWRSQYYYDGYNGGLTHAMLQALLISHMVNMYSRAYFYSHYAWRPPMTTYYSSPACALRSLNRPRRRSLPHSARSTPYRCPPPPSRPPH